MYIWYKVQSLKKIKKEYNTVKDVKNLCRLKTEIGNTSIKDRFRKSF